MNLEQFEEPKPDIRKAVEKLNSKKEDQRAEAEQQLQALGDKKLEELLAFLTAEAKKRRDRRKWVAIGVGSYMTFMVGTAIFTHNTAMLGSMGSMTGIIAAVLAMSQAQKNATKEIAEEEDIRIIPFLVEGLESQDKDLTNIAQERLPALLPRLKESDAELLSKEHRAVLNRVLGSATGKWRIHSRKPELLCAILKGYEQVGDADALPAVEKLAKGEGMAALELKVKQAANDCLPFLRERIERLEAQHTLLRASSASSYAQPEELLRPVITNQIEIPAEELLRASQKDENLPEG
jgi:hypothetical protein